MSDLKLQEACALMMLELAYCARFYPDVWWRHHREIAQQIVQEELHWMQSELN